MGSFINLVGNKFGRLTVIKEGDRKSNGSVKWICSCECGKTRSVDSHALRSGHTQSCGCLNRENNIKAITKHGMAKRGKWHPLYGIWSQIRHRCSSPKFKQYKDYGGRGIKVCERWGGVDGFENFLSDMGERPDGHSIDRIDNNGDYSPDNCRWATQSEQHRNTRSNKFVEAFGEKKTIAEWSEIYGVNKKTLAARINRGVPPEDAITKQARGL